MWTIIYKDDEGKSRSKRASSNSKEGALKEASNLSQRYDVLQVKGPGNEIINWSPELRAAFAPDGMAVPK